MLLPGADALRRGPGGDDGRVGPGDRRRGRRRRGRRGDALGRDPQRRQLRVERLAGAGRLVAVAVPGDPLERHRRPRRVAVQRAAGGLHRDLAGRRDAVQRELPADEDREGAERHVPDRHRLVRADDGDARAVGVVALRLRSDDGLVDAARAALEHLPEAVDEEVVADVVPAVGVAVVAADPEDDPRGVRRSVLVRADRVVDEGHLHDAVVRRRARRDAVGAPGGARGDRERRGGLRDPGDGLALAVDADRVHVQPGKAAARPDLELVDLAEPHRVRRPSGGLAVGGVAVAGVQVHPAAPLPATAATTQLGGSRAGSLAPGEAGERDAPRGAQDGARRPAAGGDRRAVPSERDAHALGGERPARGRERGRAVAQEDAAGAREGRQLEQSAPGHFVLHCHVFDKPCQVHELCTAPA